MVAIATILLGGCAPKEEVRTPDQPFTYNPPPPGYVEEKMKAREKAPKPGRPADR